MMITCVIIFVKNSNQKKVSSKERKRKERSKIILYSIELRKIKVDCVDELKMEIDLIKNKDILII